MSEPPGGTLTVLHTEIEGSTLLTVRLVDRYPEVLATHCALLRAAFAAHEGHEVDTQGDSFFVVFPRATQAVAAAVAMQRAARAPHRAPATSRAAAERAAVARRRSEVNRRGTLRRVSSHLRRMPGLDAAFARRGLCSGSPSRIRWR